MGRVLVAGSTTTTTGAMLALGWVLLAASPAAGQTVPLESATRYLAGTLLVSQAAAETGSGTASVTIDNRGPGPDRLLAVTVPQSATAGLVGPDGATLAALDLPAGTVTVMKADGARIMLRDFPEPLKGGDRVPGTLVFERAGPLRVEFVVQGAVAPPP